MEDLFCIDLTHNEINFIRQCLDLPSISGKDAKFLSNLQSKIESELLEIQQQKAKELEKAVESNQTK